MMASPGPIVAPPAARYMLAACDADEAALPHDARAATLARLETMMVRCGLPAETLGLAGDCRVLVRPSPDTDHAKVDCLLAEIQKNGLKQRLDFAGSEAYDVGNRQT